MVEFFVERVPVWISGATALVTVANACFLQIVVRVIAQVCTDVFAIATSSARVIVEIVQSAGLRSCSSFSVPVTPFTVCLRVEIHTWLIVTVSRFTVAPKTFGVLHSECMV
jgi:hypothetical protein